MSPVSHEFNISRGAVRALPIVNRSFKHVTELELGAKELRSYKVHHTPVLNEIVL